MRTTPSSAFEHQHEAERFLADLKARLARFGLTLHPDKTRLIEFGRSAIANRHARGLGKPESFDFLGFTHYCATRRSGSGFVLGRKPVAKRMRAKLREIKGAAHGHTARRNRKAGPLALPGSARLDGLLCCANERLSDLSIPASHDRTLARRSDASKPTTSINVDENEENR